MYDGLSFLRVLMIAMVTMAAHLKEHLPGENPHQFMIFNNWYKVCKTKNIPPMVRSKTYAYPPLVLIAYFCSLHCFPHAHFSCPFSDKIDDKRPSDPDETFGNRQKISYLFNCEHRQCFVQNIIYLFTHCCYCSFLE